MKKTAIAASMALACTIAQAQSDVSFYGVMDMGLSVDHGGIAGPSTRVTSGMATQSRWGFRGTEQISDDLAAFFVLEGGIHGDTGGSTQGNTLFGRNTAVGLRSRLGSVSAGLQDTPLFTTLNVVVDPLRNGIIRSNNLMSPTGFRAGNSVLFRSADYHGWSGDLMYVAGEVPGNSAASRAFGGSFGYASGALNARIAFHHKNNDTATLTGTDPARNWLAGANYDFGPFRGYAGYQVNKGLNSDPLPNGTAVFGGPTPVSSTDSRALLLGASVPMGASTVTLSYVGLNDRTVRKQNAQQMGLAYAYAFSKRTDVYTSYALIRNHNGAAYTEGNSEEPGTGNRQFTAGLRHRF